jgi:hypothetical protein
MDLARRVEPWIESLIADGSCEQIPSVCQVLTDRRAKAIKDRHSRSIARLGRELAKENPLAMDRIVGVASTRLARAGTFGPAGKPWRRRPSTTDQKDQGENDSRGPTVR